MFLTETDFINAKLMAEGAMNESDIIKYILNNDISSCYSPERMSKNKKMGKLLKTREMPGYQGL